ncbi:hypothetical protein [Robiginitalea aurantiaca]|uniref:Lipocalin-like domain-containing protein n=1 Tax=Robiginitalea aurantiaca TaxID=3056915 RepID=A0ABT7WIE2_9FLAO|nr:hypothetical protein [Robiginitalea aurantiaca]MDM9632676.1 hypothetical protein [Robiginitalea aurantiaca]
MKGRILSALLCVFSLFSSASQEANSENLLEGTTLDYYQNGSAVDAKFADSNFHFKWFLAPNLGENGSCGYQSRRIGDKLYLVSFSYEPSKAYVTIVFNFNQMVFSTSAWIMPGTEEEMALFEAGIIKELTLMEH